MSCVPRRWPKTSCPWAGSVDCWVLQNARAKLSDVPQLWSSGSSLACLYNGLHVFSNALKLRALHADLLHSEAVLDQGPESVLHEVYVLPGTLKERKLMAQNLYKKTKKLLGSCCRLLELYPNLKGGDF